MSDKVNKKERVSKVKLQLLKNWIWWLKSRLCINFAGKWV
jgi:hypothetical protein